MGERVLTSNRRAFHDYHVEERMEAGLVLVGSEVKSMREGRCHLQDAFVVIDKGEAWLMDAHINTYVYSNIQNHDPVRPRKLLFHKNEIIRLNRKIEQKGFTAIPLSIYLKDGYVKVEIGLAVGKKQYDKRADLRKADDDREMRRSLKERSR